MKIKKLLTSPRGGNNSGEMNNLVLIETLLSGSENLKRRSFLGI